MTLGGKDNGVGRSTVEAEVMQGVASLVVLLGENSGFGAFDADDDGLGRADAADAADELEGEFFFFSVLGDEVSDGGPVAADDMFHYVLVLFVQGEDVQGSLD